jgi:hypothetical protein
MALSLFTPPTGPMLRGLSHLLAFVGTQHIVECTVLEVNRVFQH